MNADLIFDKSVFLTLRSELGAEDATEVLTAFLSDTSSKMDVLASGVPDRSIARREAHAIKSSAATFGFSELARLARELELGAQGASPANLQQAIAAIQISFGEISAFARASLLDPNLEIA